MHRFYRIESESRGIHEGGNTAFLEFSWKFHGFFTKAVENQRKSKFLTGLSYRLKITLILFASNDVQALHGSFILRTTRFDRKIQVLSNPKRLQAVSGVLTFPVY